MKDLHTAKLYMEQILFIKECRGRDIMAIRFRKSKSSGPFRVTASKSGLHTSVGGKGFRMGVGTNGKVRTTISIPGTGISYTSTKGGSKSHSNSNSSRSYSNSNSYDSSVTSFGFVIKLLFVLFLPFLLWFGFYLSWDNMALSIIVTAIIEVVTVVLIFGKPQTQNKISKKKSQSISCEKNEWICPDCETVNSNTSTICKGCGRYK